MTDTPATVIATIFDFVEGVKPGHFVRSADASRKLGFDRATINEVMSEIVECQPDVYFRVYGEAGGIGRM